jgi:hypothetical protein
MRNSLNKILLLLLLSFVISCNKKEEVDKEDNNIVKIDSFEYNLKNKEKIFLDFWSGMNDNDFFKVYLLLESKNIMSNKSSFIAYKLGEDEVRLSKGNKLKFKFSDEVFYKNSKNKNIECIYLHLERLDLVKLFIKKYNITDYIEVNVKDYFIEENPLYGLNDSEIKDEIEIKQVKPEKLKIEDLMNIQYNENCHYTIISKGSCNRNMYKGQEPDSIFRSFLGNSKRIHFTNNNIVINKGNNKLLIFNATLDYWKENPNTMGDEYFKAIVFYPYGTKESKFRIISLSDRTDVFVTYTTKKYYEKIISEEETEKSQDAEKDRKEKERIEERKTESLHEI